MAGQTIVMAADGTRRDEFEHCQPEQARTQSIWPPLTDTSRAFALWLSEQLLPHFGDVVQVGMLVEAAIEKGAVGGIQRDA